MANRYWLLSNLSLSGGENALTWNPHPTEFAPHTEVKVSGTGDGVGLGYFSFKWTSGEGILSATQWNHLMSFFSGWEPSIDMFVRTRTDRTVMSAGGYREFEYLWFSVVMWRPQAEPYHGFRYRNVEIVFTHATEI